jgi:hypothetical protein
LGGEGRAGFTLDAGGGAAVATISWQGFEGSDGRWGDGSDDPACDAEGDSVLRQISVFYQYLNQGTFDSENPAVLEWGEFEEDGVYSPFAVSFEEPSMTFDPEENTNIYRGDITLVATRDVAAYVSQLQNNK